MTYKRRSARRVGPRPVASSASGGQRQSVPFCPPSRRRSSRGSTRSRGIAASRCCAPAVRHRSTKLFGGPRQASRRRASSVPSCASCSQASATSPSDIRRPSFSPRSPPSITPRSPRSRLRDGAGEGSGSEAGGAGARRPDCREAASRALRPAVGGPRAAEGERLLRLGRRPADGTGAGRKRRRRACARQTPEGSGPRAGPARGVRERSR